MDASAHFRGKKITVMGLGLLGRGVGDAKYLAECGAELIVTDPKSAEELAPSVEALKDFKNITFVLGEHRLEDFRDRDLIVKTGGIPLDSPYLAEAKKNNIPVQMSADLFAEYAGIPVIGITGTRGKSSVTHMIAAVLTAAGKSVLLGGNVRGISTLALLKDVQGDEIAVLELDSWQLQGFGDAHISPNIAVFTTFYDDHLNYYHGDKAAYLADKANIFLNQKEDDLLIMGSQCAGEIQNAYRKQFKGKFEVWGEHDLPSDWALKIPGAHNRYNAALALAVARAMKINDSITKQALADFKGVPGRLELIREVGGVKIYNDTTATTPEATIAALNALAPREGSGKNQNVILIFGGADKNLDMNQLLVEIPKYTKRVIMLAGTGTNRVLEFLPNASVFDSLSAAVKEAFAAAQPGDSILFSPAFASFGMFKNEYDRGDQFNTLTRAL
ncbi:MAG TPA: UDP-N-acetylmuramoyl-L-alanine--D-glutamate ligase [Candidatus Paceibacterota bacterium]|nr:UDP-N-acetylmuramoyl-L-alanine--D-glutamate ligase [Candidatus Paceibacterota bacterium]